MRPREVCRDNECVALDAVERPPEDTSGGGGQADVSDAVEEPEDADDGSRDGFLYAPAPLK